MIHNTEPKVNETSTTSTTNNCKEVVLFNSDTLSKIISYLPSIDLLSLGLTCKRFGISDDDKLSVIKMSADILVHEIATEEQLAALPHYDGESSLADYHYLQLMREPLTFDQLVGDIDYVNTDDKSCVIHGRNTAGFGTAFSNNTLRAGKHFATFALKIENNKNVMVGIMRPGQANQYACNLPLHKQDFYQNFSRSIGRGKCNNNVHCCMYNSSDGNCYSTGWEDYGDGRTCDVTKWDGSESMSSGGEIGLLLDLDEGTLSVYKNGRKLGVMKKELAGEYCWVVSVYRETSVTIKRGTRGTSPPN